MANPQTSNLHDKLDMKKMQDGRQSLEFVAEEAGQAQKATKNISTAVPCKPFNDNECMGDQSHPSIQPLRPEHPPTWKAQAQTDYIDSKRQQQIRRDMVHVLDERLGKISKQNGKTRDEAHQIAEKLECMLFQNSTSFLNYSDQATLDERMRSLLTAKLHRRLVQHSTKDERRSHVLHTILGSERYQRTRLLIRDIREEKNKLASTQLTCSEGKCCSSSKVAATRPTSFHVQMPQPVRDLFFDTTPLLNAFEKSPIETLYKIDWDTLLAEGFKSLESYRKWEQSSTCMT